MITFDQARDIVAEHRSSSYPPEADYQVATWGWENSTEYLVVSGAYAMVYPARSGADREWLEDADGPYTTVNKVTGDYSEHWGEPFELANGTPVGSPSRTP